MSERGLPLRAPTAHARGSFRLRIPRSSCAGIWRVTEKCLQSAGACGKISEHRPNDLGSIRRAVGTVPPRRRIGTGENEKEAQTPMAVKAKPDGYHSITPYLIVRGGAAAIDYYKAAFGAVEQVRMPGPGGTIGHAEIRIGDSVVMLADEPPDQQWRSPQSLGGSPVGLLALRRRRGRPLQPGPRRRRQGPQTPRQPVLRRPLRHPGRPLRPPVDDRHPYRRRLPRRDEAADGRDDEEGGVRVSVALARRDLHDIRRLEFVKRFGDWVFRPQLKGGSNVSDRRR